MALLDNYNLLLDLLPYLKTFRYGGGCEACQEARKESLEIALKDFFSDIKLKYNTEESSFKNYDNLRTIILSDSSLTPEQKIKLITRMTPSFNTESVKKKKVIGRKAKK